VLGTVTTIADRVAQIQDDRPGLVIIGETVNFRNTVQWYDDCRPLAGKKILVGRSRPGPSDVTRRLRALGATVTESSWVHAILNPSALSQLVTDRPWDRHSVILFACREGAQAFYNGLRGALLDWRALSNCRIAAMGDDVAEFLRDLGIAPDMTAPGHCREAVFTIAKHVKGQNICIITGDRGRPQLTQDLSDIAKSVTECPLYTVSRTPLKQHANAPIDAAIVPSSTTAEDVVGILRSTTGCETTPIITIGPRSSAAVRALTWSTVIQTETDTIDAVIQLVKQVIVEGTQPL
jgi:uroporphyrinogen III methyltransferase/synthase